MAGSSKRRQLRKKTSCAALLSGCKMRDGLLGAFEVDPPAYGGVDDVVDAVSHGAAGDAASAP